MSRYNWLTSLKRKIIFARYAIKPFRPIIVWRQFSTRIRTQFLGHKGLRIIDLALSYECNLTCEHCSAKVLENSKKPLGLDEYKDIAQQAHGLDNISWNITGGEPLLVSWLDDLIPVLNPSCNYISIQTNCVDLTAQRARQLASLGVNCITTSIDSLSPEEHDAFRGMKGAFSKTIEGIVNARNAGMNILIACMVTHSNLRSLELRKLIEYINSLGAIALFNLAVPCGNWENHNEEILRDDDRQYLFRLLNEYPKTSTDHEVAHGKTGCPAGVEKIYITAYGEVLPCPFLHITFGNVRNEPLDNIVNKMRSVSFFNDAQPVCLAAEDPDIHRDVIGEISKSDSPRPLSWEQIFK